MIQRLVPALVLLLALLLSACGRSPGVVAPTPASAVNATPDAGMIVVTWQDNSDDETGFTVFRKAESEAEFSVVASVEADVTRYEDRDVAFGVGYRYFVVANGAGADAAPARLEASEGVVLENLAPSADAQELSAAEDAPLAITLTGSDPEGAELTFEITSEPEHGALSGDAPELTYTPAADFVGDDAFGFRVSDGELTSAEATVTIGVLPAEPEASATSIESASDQAAVGEDPVAIVVQLRDSEGDPVEKTGVPVTLVASSGGLRAADEAPARSLTLASDASGRIEAVFVPDVNGPATIAVHWGAEATGEPVASVTVAVGMVVMDDRTVVYDGRPHGLAPRFLPVEAARHATLTYVRVSDGTPVSGIPSRAGVYEGTVTAPEGYAGSASAILTIEPRTLRVRSDVAFDDKTYDGSSAATLSAELDTHRVASGDDIALAPGARGEFQLRSGDGWVASPVAGVYGADDTTRVVGTLELVGADAANYVLEQPVGSAEIAPLPLTFDGSAESRPYDGSSAATVSGALSPEPLASDDVALTATFVAPDAATDVRIEVALEGADAANYALVDPALTADITPRSATVSAEDRGKVYGAALELGGAGFGVDGLVDGESLESVTLASAGAAADADVGSYEITVADAVAGAGTNLANYDLAYAFGELVVEPAVLTVIPDADQAKTYGEADPAALTFRTEGLVDGDTVDGATLVRDEGENAGSYAYGLGDLSVTDGADGANYRLELADGAGFEIRARPLTITPDADQGKIYGDADPLLGFTSAELVDDDAFAGALGREAGEDVGGYAFTLGDLTVVDGNEGANYDLVLADAPEDAPGFGIEPRTLTLSGAFTAENRPYDGTVDAAVASDELILENVVEGDAVDLLPVAVFDDRHVANGKTVSLSGATAIAGTAVEAGNYLLDLTGAPTATADIVKAAISFEIANEDSLVYDGRTALPLVVVTDPAPAPEGEPVAYQLRYRLVTDNEGSSVDRGVSAIRDAGEYRVTVTSTDARYEGEDVLLVTVAHRPLTLTSDASGTTYGEPDPVFAPVIAAGTLGADDALGGELGRSGSDDAGSYPFELGTIAIERGGADVSANYALTFDGSFEIAPAPVAFDIANSDFVSDGVHVFQRNGSSQVGLDISSDPADVTDFVLSYRRTHDADYAPVPAARQPVPAIGQLGTYEVTIETTDPNFVGSSVRTVWLTDTSSVAFGGEGGGELGVTEALVGGTSAVTFEFTAGPVPVTFDLAATPSGVTFLDPETGEAISSITFEPGAGSLAFEVRADALADAPYQLTATPSGDFAGRFAPLAWTLEARAELVLLDAAPTTGAGAASAPLAVELRGADGNPFAASAPIELSLDGDTGLVFRNEADDADVTTVTIGAGESRATFRATAESAGSYVLRVANASSRVGIAATADATLTVTPRPTADSLAPSSLEKGQTTNLVITGNGFAAGLTASFGGSDISVDSVTVDGPTQATLVVTIDTSSATGTRDLTLVNADGGTSTAAGALTLTVPTLSAADDGPFELVESGNVELAIADLLANDGSSSETSVWGFEAVTATTNVDVARAGDALNVSSTGSFGQPASFDYRIVDEFGTTATATVTFAVSLPPVDALLFTDAAEFSDFRTTEYSVPTFQEVFDSWPRVSGSTYYADPNAVPSGSSADAWEYLTNDVTGDGAGDPRVSQPNNVSPPEGFVSPEADAQDYFTFEATLFSDDTDDDSIGLIAAFTNDGGTPRYLVAHRTYGGNDPRSGWGLSLYDGWSYSVLVEPSVPAFDTSASGWNSAASRVKVERTGDILRLYASDWNATGSYDPDSEIVVDLANDTVTVNGTTTTVAQDLEVFRGRKQYGYFTYSQPNSTYLDIAFEGGVARDTAILLTGGSDTDATPGDDRWTGSEVWRFEGGSWLQDAGATIQTELDYPRTVTSVAEPGTGSGYGSYSDYGSSFRVLAGEVLLETP